MLAVTPGSVAPRAPPSVAALRAFVCESDFEVGAMNTSAAASAAATGAGGSSPCSPRASITHEHGVGARPRAAASRSALAERARLLVDDDDDLLARRARRGSGR